MVMMMVTVMMVMMMMISVVAGMMVMLNGDDDSDSCYDNEEGDNNIDKDNVYGCHCHGDCHGILITTVNFVNGKSNDYGDSDVSLYFYYQRMILFVL